MPDFDKQRIIQGTPSKRIRLAHAALLESPSEENVEHLYETYSEIDDVQTLLDNSRYIFSEPKKGLPFYKSLMESGCIPFLSYYNEKEKVKEFLFTYQERMNSTTESVYKELLEFVEELYDTHKNCLVVEHTLREDPDIVTHFCTEAYKTICGRGSRTDLEEAFQQLSPFGKILHATERATDLDLEYEIGVDLQDLYTEASAQEDMDSYSQTMDLHLLMGKISQDAPIMESCRKFENKHLNMNFAGLANQDFVDAMAESVLLTMPIPDMEHDDFPLLESVEQMYEDVLSDSSYCVSPEKLQDYDTCLKKYIAYEHVLDYVLADETFFEGTDLCVEYELVSRYAYERGYDPDTVTYSDAVLLMTEAVAELEETLHSFLEYNDDGTQTSVMRRHASNLRETDGNPKNEKSNRWKENSKDSQKDSSDDASENEDEADKIADEENGNEEGESTSKEKPKMAKQDLHTKIQAKALDADVKAKGMGAKVKKLGSDVVQTGKAVLKVPMNIVNGIKGVISGWNKMSEDKKKEEMLKPGYRKMIYANLKKALTYGIAGMINPLLMIVVFFAQKASAEKNIYIRNELAMELQTEIKICDAKISDAESSGNHKDKYRLMRIKDKLEKERVRVIVNAKHI